ncbi:MAG TPA: DUF86 domain-containing protein [Myxococcota bacterium]|nr:DUF86 domain-containing protein [Myxococcota bacterium]HRY95187.1 DUF86 domain-containing protein [Myxococcota bacterium]HSA20412.1 DUF86 domain-containing protein [Myxococcota bacterium]
MVDREVFDRRLSRLELLLSHLRRLAAGDRAAYLMDAGLQAQAERWLHLASECCLDLANHLISDRGWRTPATYRETFDVLLEQDVLDEALAAKMQAWAGLRNVLAHLYLTIDHQILWGVLQSDLDQLEAYARALLEAVDGLAP